MELSSIKNARSSSLDSFSPLSATNNGSPHSTITSLASSPSLLPSPSATAAVAVASSPAPKISSTPISYSQTAYQRKFAERVKEFEECIKGPLISLSKIRALAIEGIPEANGLRSMYWKILLRYLSGETAEWDTFLHKKRSTYADWVKELVVDPHEKEQQMTVAGGAVEDHPLSQERGSAWNTYFRDKEMLFEIEKDVKRTLPHLHFFQNSVEGSTLKHSEALTRILFIYAKLNPGIKYVQGMNELLAPIYYVLAHDANASFRQSVEADSFFCFTALMSEVMNNFLKSLDGSEDGIVGNMLRLNQTLKMKDMQLWANLEEKKMNPQFYSFRWITLLLSQEFQLPDVLRLWDALFADPHRFEFLLYVCCAMLVLVRDELLANEFADNLKLLQNYPNQDVSAIIAKARSLRGI